MCAEVIVDGSRCKNIGELQRAVGGRAIIPSANRNSFGWECCLCPVDIEATAAKYGFTLTRSDDPMLYGELRRS